MAAQISGAFAGFVAAHAMFELPIVQVSARIRATLREGLGESIVTFGLVVVILFALRFRARRSRWQWPRYHKCLLVYVLDVIRQSRCDVCTGDDRYNCRHLSAERTAFVVGQLLGGAAAALFARWLLGGQFATPADPR